MSQPLFEECIQKGDIPTLKRLLRDDARLATQNTSQLVSPLMLSCYYKNPQVAEVLLDFISELTLFEAAAVGKIDSVAHHLSADANSINNYSEDGFTALGLAAYFGQEEVTRYLLLKGADPNLPSNNGFGVYPIHSAVAANHEMVVKMLFRRGRRSKCYPNERNHSPAFGCLQR